MNTKEPSNRRKIILFFFLAYFVSWIFWIPQAFMANGYSVPEWFAQFLANPWNPEAFGRFISAASLTLYSKGLRGFLVWLKKGIDFHFRKRWLIPIFGLPPFVYRICLWIASANGWIEAKTANFANPGFYRWHLSSFYSRQALFKRSSAGAVTHYRTCRNVSTHWLLVWSWGFFEDCGICRQYSATHW